MTIDIERLKRDLDYWLSVAPEGATHYGPDDALHLAAWFKNVADGKADCMVIGEEPEWVNGRFMDAVMIPRPSPAWDDSGLPEEGTVCRMRLAFRTEDRITITYMGDGVFCYRAENGMEYTGSLSDAAFEPLKTEKERVVIAALGVAKEPEDDEIHPRQYLLDSLNALYDAGALKEPTND